MDREPGHYLERELYSQVSANPAIFEFIQAGSLDGIWYWDLENPTNEWMSPRYKEVFGYSDDELPNTATWWRANIFPEDLPLVVENFHKHREQPSVPFDQIVRFRHKDGSTVWVRCRGLIIRDGAGTPIRMLGAHTDVTAIKRTEERLRALSEASPDMFFAADLETGIISECNHALLESTGEAIIAGRCVLDLCDPQSVLDMQSAMRTLKTEPEIRNLELTLARKEGPALTVLLSANTAGESESGGKTLRAWCRDISYLRRFANVEALISAFSTPILLADEKGLISSTNPAADQLFGYRQGELIGQTLIGLLAELPGADALPLTALLERATVSDLQGIQKDGSAFPVHLGLSVIRLGEGTFLVATIADMTARKAMENALRDSEHRFRQLIESLPQLVWTCLPDGRCDYVSPQWIAYTGCSAEDGLGHGWANQVHHDDCETLSAAWEVAIRLGQPVHFVHRYRNAAGRYRWFEARATPLRNIEGQIVKWYGTSSDIHDARETRLALEREQRRLANLVSLAPAVFCSFAVRSDRTSYFPYASPEIGDLLGIGLDSLQRNAAAILSLFDPEELARVRTLVQASGRDLSRLSLQCKIDHPARGVRWIEANFTPTIDSDKSIVWHGFLTDVTERKREQEGEQFLLRLGSELQAKTDPEIITLIATEMLAEHFDLARCSFASVNMARRETTLLRQYTRHGPPQPYRTHALNHWANERTIQSLESGDPIVIDDLASHPDSAPYYSSAYQLAAMRAMIAVPLRRGGICVGVIGLFDSKIRAWRRNEVDIARAAAERVWPAYDAARALAAERTMYESLAASEQRLRVALQAASIGIWEQNILTGERLWDTRCKAMFGFPPDMTIDPELVFSCIHPDDRSNIRKQVQQFSDAQGPGHFEAEYRIVAWNDGSLRHIYGRGQMFFEGEGMSRRAVRSIGTMQDITALKQGEQALRRVNHELEQFAYAAAHDLQEPLRNVGLATQILASRYKGKFDSDADGLLKAAVEGPMRMQEMVKDLLAYSRALTSDEGAANIADSNLAVNLALNNLHTAILEKNAEIVCDELPLVRMSELHLMQVFQNLIGNSLKYSGSRRPKIHISSARRSGQCAFLVRDNGVGIPSEYHSKAFGVFKRLHNTDVPGTGIGLALCKRIVEHYEGQIWIESNQHEEGTTVLFTPPLAEEKVAR